jgi:Domain of unknown function (DUF4288)
MGYVPDDAEWFLADLVMEHRIEGDPRNVVHVNTVLVKASSAKEAYARAMELGTVAESHYKNTDNMPVDVVFRGLGELLAIHDNLEHGAELTYSEHIGLSEEEVGRMVRPGQSLGVFRDREPSIGPNYMPNEIWGMLVDQFGEDAVRDLLDRGDRP